MNAYAITSNTPVKSTRRPTVKWTDAEWFQVFDEVWAARRAAGATTFNMSLEVVDEVDVNLTPSEVTRANKKLFDEPRQRTIIAFEHLDRGPCLKAFTRWIEQLPETQRAQAVIAEFAEADEKNFTPVEPVIVSAEANVSGVKPRVRWNSDAWYAIACELIKRQPVLMLNSKTLASIKVDDVERAARHVFPGESHPVFIMSKVKPMLLEAVVLYRINKAEEERLAQEASVKASKTESPADALMTALAMKVSETLLPQLDAKLHSMLEGMVLTRIETILGDVLERYAPQLASVLPNVVTEKERQKRIAIVGAWTSISVVEERLAREFPEYRFTILGRDPRNLAEQLRQCDYVLCATDGISHSTAHTAKNAVTPERFRRFNGGESAMIRCLRNLQVTSF